MKQKTSNPNTSTTRREPSLRFTPTAWAKLLHFRDCSEDEVGGFGLTDPDDLLLVRDFVTVKQKVTLASVEFDDEAVADFFESQVEAGRRPEQFARIWLHTHPGESPEPSLIDRETFDRVFGRCEWAVMFILSRTGKIYCRLQFNTGPGGAMAIPVEVDYSGPFAGSDFETWDAEFKANVSVARNIPIWDDDVDWSWDDGPSVLTAACPDQWMEELETMEPSDRLAILDEMNARSLDWAAEEMEVADERE